MALTRIKSSNIADETVVAADIADGSVTDAKIQTGVSSSKLTGNLPALNGSALTNLASANLSGALPAISGANLTGVSTDTSAMENNIAILAFKTQSANNLAKFNLVDQVIDEYKDGTGVTFSTAGQTGPNAVEGYISSGTINNGTPAHVNGDRTSYITVTSDITLDSGVGPWSNLVDGGIANNTTDSLYFNQLTGIKYIRFQFSGAKRRITKIKHYDTSAINYGTVQFQGSDDGSTWTNIDNTFTYQTAGVNGADFSVTNTEAYQYYQILFQGGQNSANHWWREIEFDQSDQVITMSAAGTATSIANTALTAPTTGDICMLIENFAGTATLNTDIKAYVSRNGGTGWDQATLLDKGTWGTNKKILVANNVAFSNSASGTDMRYKIEWANQASGSKETRVHATSLAWA